MVFIEILRMKADDGQSLLRLVKIGGEVQLMLNNLETNEAVGMGLTSEDIVKLGQALIEAWELSRGIEHE